MTNKLLEKLQINTDKLVLYAPDSLNYITNIMIEKTLEKLPEIYSFFDITNFRKIQINLFDDLEKFRKFIINLRDGDEKSLPEYAKGTYDEGMVNSYIPTNIQKESPQFIEKIYNPSHEIVHILYMELILKDNYDKRIIWLDEGLAQYLSWQRDEYNEPEKLKHYFEKVINNTKIYPNLNELKHGITFCNDNYNAYDLSYLCVKYLFDTKNKEEIRNIVFSYEKSIKIGESILEEMLNYYKKIFRHI